MIYLSRKIVIFWLKWCAKAYLVVHRPTIVIIGGTTGRFWVKEKIIVSLQEKSFSIRTNKKNFNSEIGLPLSVLGLESGEGSIKKWTNNLFLAAAKIFSRDKTNYLVLEMAIAKPYDMNYLLSIVKPDILVISGITMIYRENFHNLDKIADEFNKIIKSLPQNGLAVLNADDERLKKISQHFSGRKIFYGINQADYQAADIKKEIDGYCFKIKNPAGKVSELKIREHGLHHVYAELIKIIFDEKIPVM